MWKSDESGERYSTNIFDDENRAYTEQIPTWNMSPGEIRLRLIIGIIVFIIGVIWIRVQAGL